MNHLCQEEQQGVRTLLLQAHIVYIAYHPFEAHNFMVRDP